MQQVRQRGKRGKGKQLRSLWVNDMVLTVAERVLWLHRCIRLRCMNVYVSVCVFVFLLCVKWLHVIRILCIFLLAFIVHRIRLCDAIVIWQLCTVVCAWCWLTAHVLKEHSSNLVLHLPPWLAKERKKTDIWEISWLLLPSIFKNTVSNSMYPVCNTGFLLKIYYLPIWSQYYFSQTRATKDN